ncbi:MAG: Gfo/Idh/MocA family oxidoreductase [Calditrichaeota bacterium]|nr:Gfo/Idh/MocA family oxidoreductase [Calditrichota bacterium]
MGLKFAQIGVGNWGKNIFRNFYDLPDVEMVRASDLNDKILKGIASNYPEVKTTKDAASILNDPKIDAVVIATVPETHFELARQALENGKHVFVEKPMTLVSHESEKLVELAEKKNLKLMVGHILEYHPAYLKVKEYLDSGELGEVRYLYSTRVNLGVVRKKENALWSLAPHDISIALMLLGKNPSRVVCTGQSYLQPGIEDVAFATVHFPDGKMAQLHVSWLDPHKIRKLTVVGSKKMVVLDDMESTEKIRLYDKGVEFKEDFTGYQEALTLRVGDIHIPKLTMQEPLKLECQHFVDAILNDTQPRSNGFDGLQVVKILEAADKSLKNHGEPVEIR